MRTLSSNPCLRFLRSALLAGLLTGPALAAGATPADAANSGVHDFDFLIGQWHVHHRRLKERLAHSNEWIEFEGESTARTVLGGTGNIDDNLLQLPGGSYRAVTLRAFDPANRLWSIWWLDARAPQGPLDPALRGSFVNGIGTFFANDTFAGRPIRVRYIWSHITAKSCQWEQAFSDDGGKSWETNWVMLFSRVH